MNPFKPISLLLLISGTLTAQVPGTMMGMDTAELNNALQSMAAAFGQNTNMPESYTFDLVMDVLIEAEDEDPMPMSFMIRRDGKQTGIKTTDKGETSIIVIDRENNINGMFMEDKKGEKTGMALPNFVSAYEQLAWSETAQQQETDPVSFKKTGKTKEVAGYQCEEYHAVSSDEDALIYLTRELDMDWKQMMGGSVATYVPMFNLKMFGEMEGTMLESHSKEPSTGKMVHWTTTAVNAKGMTILKSDYRFMGE